MNQPRLVDPHGQAVNLARWIRLCQAAGIGEVLAETTVPLLGGEGDVIIRTKWFGMVIPELDVGPFSTAARLGHGGAWWDLEQYDTEQQAAAGHTRWSVRLASTERVGPPLETRADDP